MGFYKQFFNLLNLKQKIKFITLIFLSIIILFLELLSIGLIIPLITLILEPEKFITNLNLKNLDYIEPIKYYLNSENFIFYFFLFFIFLFVVKNALILYNFYKQYEFIENIEINFSISIFKNYLSQKYPFFYTTKTSSLITKLTADFHNFTIGFIGQIVTIASETLIVFGFIFLIFYLNLYKVGAVFLVFFLIGLVVMKVIGSLSAKWGKDRTDFDHLKINLLNDTFQNIKSVIIDNKKDDIVNRFSIYVKKLASINKKLFTSKAFPRSVFEIIGIVSLSSAIIFMIYLNYDKTYILTTAGFFVAVAYRVLPSFQKIIYCYQTINFSKVVLNSIERDIALQKSIVNTKEKLEFKQTIKLKNILFKYDDRKNLVLNNLNLKIQKGKSVGIYGDSGSGKSTLVDILSCLNEPDEGQILVDDVSINNNILVRKWQNQIAYVSQNTLLYDDTIANNIALLEAESKNNSNEIWEVIEKVQLSNFIKTLPGLLNTKVGEMGSKLSGGQIKRIGIARALFKKPKLLILDEATNALDKETEGKILDMVFNLSKDITIVMITHDMQLLKNVDIILKLENGKIVEK